MKVSIVIPCYNEKDTIEKIVEAVHNAPLENKEIIVVDDCSEDGTQTLLRDKVAPMARAAVAAGADGLLIEVHHAPETALCDGAQSLYPEQFRELMSQLNIIAPAVQRKMGT